MRRIERVLKRFWSLPLFGVAMLAQAQEPPNQDPRFPGRGYDSPLTEMPENPASSTLPINAPPTIIPDPYSIPVETGISVGEDLTQTPPPKCPTCLQRMNPFYYLRHDVNHCASGRHHLRFWQYSNGEHHGYPYGCSPYEPRAAGASYTFGQWMPRRSFYYAYEPGGQGALPYGFSPEPYYNPDNRPVQPPR